MNETNDKWKKVKIGEFLTRYKEPVNIIDEKEYKQVTIRTNHQGIKLRKAQLGKKIGTKKQFIVHKGLFLMSKIDARYGAFGIVPQELDGAIITGNFWAYVVKEDIIDIDYFNQYTNSPDFYELCERASSGITHRKYLQENEFLKFEIEIPDLTTQKQIYINNRIFANRIDTISDSMYQRDNILTSLRQQILEDAITGKLSEKWRKETSNIESAEILLEKIKTEKEKLVKEGKIRKQKPLPPITEIDKPFELPEGWTWCRLADLLLSSDYGTSEKAFPDSTGVPVLGMGNIQDQKVILDAPKKLSYQSKDLPRLLLKYNDLLFNRTNSYELVGKSAIYKGNDDEYTFASYLIRLKFPLNLVIPDYISFVINSNWFRQYIIEPQIIQQTGQANFNGTKLSESYIPVPPILEQEYIVQKMDSVISKMEEVKNHSTAIKMHIEVLNKTILKDMFSE